MAAKHRGPLAAAAQAVAGYAVDLVHDRRTGFLAALAALSPAVGQQSTLARRCL